MATFVIYVDEAGDEGFSFGRGSSDWFVLSAVIVPKARDLETVKLVDHVRAKLGKPAKKQLHFRDLKHEQRLPYLDAIAKAHVKTISVLVHKPSITHLARRPHRSGSQTVSEESPLKYPYHRLFFYAAAHLLQGISWYCCDQKSLYEKVGDGSAELVFSNRSDLSSQRLSEYVNGLRAQAKGIGIKVDSSVIRPDQVVTYCPGKLMGLQIADAVATSYFYSVQPSVHGFTEDRYVRILNQVAYRFEGRTDGYGLIFRPEDITWEAATDGTIMWVPPR
jgi:hypothetical protein